MAGRRIIATSRKCWRLSGHQRLGQGHRFIRFCDAFNIRCSPSPTFPGYLPGSHQEWAALSAMGEAFVVYSGPGTEVLLVTRKDYGGSYLAMCSRDLGADMPLPGPRGIPSWGRGCGQHHPPQRDHRGGRSGCQAQGEDQGVRGSVLEPYVAASRGYIDAVIIRARAAAADRCARAMCAKRELRPPKKHAIFPCRKRGKEPAFYME